MVVCLRSLEVFQGCHVVHIRGDCGVHSVGRGDVVHQDRLLTRVHA